MESMKHKYGSRAKDIFYATANKRGMKPKSHMPKGAGPSPSGDIGAKRAKEGKAAGGFGDRIMSWPK